MFWLATILPKKKVNVVFCDSATSKSTAVMKERLVSFNTVGLPEDTTRTSYRTQLQHGISLIGHVPLDGQQHAKRSSQLAHHTRQ